MVIITEWKYNGLEIRSLFQSNEKVCHRTNKIIIVPSKMGPMATIYETLRVRQRRKSVTLEIRGRMP